MYQSPVELQDEMTVTTFAPATGVGRGLASSSAVHAQKYTWQNIRSDGHYRSGQLRMLFEPGPWLPDLS